MKFSHLAFITISTLLIVGSITGVIIYYQKCENCRINPDNNHTNGWNNGTTIWDTVFFTLLNGSVFQTKNFIGQKLLLEIASSNCSQCTEQLEALKELNELISQNDKNITILTLLIDLETTKELLTYYINNNITWTLGNIKEENYSKLGLTVVPTFYMFNQTRQEINCWKGEMSISQLLVFTEITQIMNLATSMEYQME